MNIIVICESTDRARKESRRIISKYLPQKGSSVWLGNITQEGLREMREELKQKASRNMSVICHKITSRATHEPVFIIGSRRPFDIRGDYAFSTSKSNYIPETISSPLSTLLKEAVRFAGLFHDTGKIINHFQGKIKKKGGELSDPIRHERISAAFFLKAFGDVFKSCAHETSEPEILHKLGELSGEDWQRKAKELVGGLRNIDPSSPNIDSLCNLIKGQSEYADQFPVFHLLLQLLVTHHALLGSSPETESVEEGRMVHGFKDGHKKDALEMYQGADRLWLSERWLNRVQDSLKSLADTLEKCSGDNSPNLPELMLYGFLFARPAMVAADQQVSAEGNKIPYKGNPEGIPFANPYSDSSQNRVMDKNGEPVMAQPLVDHLIKVSRKAAYNLGTIIESTVDKGDTLPRIHTLPRNLRKKSEGDFVWQNKAFEIADRIRRKDEGKLIPAGFFGIITSGTGKGKTRCIPGFQYHLREGGARFTLAVGFRTLTRQAGSDFVNKFGFAPGTETDALIGGHFYNFGYKDFDEDVKTEEDEDLSFGELASQTTEYDMDSHNNDMPACLAGPQTGILERALRVPALVCTVDHIMAGLTNPRSNASKILPRLASGDLVIDEIDSFSFEDSQALLRLVFLAGASGRGALISSATIPPSLCRTFFKAYLKGYQQFQRIYPDAQEKIHTARLDDTPKFCGQRSFDTKDQGIVETFNRWTTEFFEMKTRKLDPEDGFSPSRKLGILDISEHRACSEAGRDKDATLKGIAQEISACIDKKHTEFGVKTKENKVISAGLIHIPLIKHAYGLFKHLYSIESSETTQRVYLLYHSRLSKECLELTEELLDSLLYRKSGEDRNDPLLEHSVVRNLIEKNPNAQDIQIIVIATSIEGIGRDHDFDYAIIDPVSQWLTIQIAGRVLRHRSQPDGKDFPPNVMMLSRPLRYVLSSSGNRLPFESPGPERKKHYELDSQFDTGSIFPKELQKGITARSIYLADMEEKSPRPKKQRYKRIDLVERDRILYDLEREVVDNDWLLKRVSIYTSDMYNKKFPFRNSQGQIEARIYLDEGEWSVQLPLRLQKHQSKTHIYSTHEVDGFIPDSQKMLLQYYEEPPLNKGSFKVNLYQNDTISKRFIHSPYVGLVELL